MLKYMCSKSQLACLSVVKPHYSTDLGYFDGFPIYRPIEFKITRFDCLTDKGQGHANSSNLMNSIEVNGTATWYSLQTCQRIYD